MISTHIAARITVRVTVEALTVPDHVKLHVRPRRQGAPESVVEEPHLGIGVRVHRHRSRSEGRPGDSSADFCLIFDPVRGSSFEV